MRILRTSLVVACFGLLLGSTVTFAQDKEDNSVGDEPAAGPNCDIIGYKTERIVYPTPVAIPDNVPSGVTLGPIFMPPDGDIINDVVLELRMAHTWVGDLILDLVYDADCTGPAAGVPARVICRPRGTAAQARVPCGTNSSTTAFGCSGNMVATNGYFFSDEGTAQLGVGALCTTTLAGGCFNQADQGGEDFAIWRGMPKGGCWYLRISDNEGADTGSVSQWAVYVRNQRPVPASPASWGSVKNIYR